jgi:hypothetical protein
MLRNKSYIYLQKVSTELGIAMKEDVSFHDVLEANKRIKSSVFRTPSIPFGCR